jgi:hypothetical protein
MAAQTFLNLQDEVLAHGFSATAYRTRVKRWLNEGQWRAARALGLREHVTTTTFNGLDRLVGDEFSAAEQQQDPGGHRR